jgi:hypothetical protein
VGIESLGKRRQEEKERESERAKRREAGAGREIVQLGFPTVQSQTKGY